MSGLPELISHVSCGAPVNDAFAIGIVLGDMRIHTQPAQLLDKIMRVLVFVPTSGEVFVPILPLLRNNI